LKLYFSKDILIYQCTLQGGSKREATVSLAYPPKSIRVISID